MKKYSLVMSLTVSALFATFMAAPVMAQDAEHDHNHGAAPSASSPVQKKKPAKTKAKTAKSKATSVDGKAGMMDMKTMCDMHKEIMSAEMPSARRAMIDEKMKGMSADEKQKQLEMMDERCK